MRCLVALAIAVVSCYSMCANAQGVGGSPQGEPPMRAAKVDNNTFSRGDALPAWAEVLRKPPATDREGYSIRLAQTQFLTTAKPDVLVFRVMQGKSGASLSQLGQYQIAFVPAYQKVRLHFVRVERGGQMLDRTTSTDIRFLEREPMLEQGIYAGTVTANLLVDDVRAGDSVHLAYSTEGRNPVFGQRSADSASWDRSEATELRVVDVVSPIAQKLRFRMHGENRRNQIDPKIKTRAEYRVTTFEESKLPPIEVELAVPSDVVTHRWLQFTEYESWKNIDDWAGELFALKPLQSAELKTQIASFKSLGTESERVSAAVRWVQQEIRYFSVSLGESSHRPHSPDEVMRRRYGDCKDKVYLLMHILSELGVRSKPVLLAAQAPKAPSLMLPWPDAFDHVVLAVDLGGANYLVDPTRATQSSPIERMTFMFPGASALLVGSGATELASLPPLHTEDATLEVEERVELKAFNAVPKMSARTVSVGFTAELLRYVLANAPTEQRGKIFTTQMEKRYPKAKLVGIPKVEDDIANNRIIITSEFDLHDAVVEREGDRLIRFAPEPFLGVVALPQTPKRAHAAIVTSVPYEAKYKFTVVWPENVSRTLDPVNSKIDSKFFSSELQRSFRGNTFTFEGRLRTKNITALPEDIPVLQEDLRKLDAAIGYVSFVPGNSINNSGFLGIGRRTLKDNLARRYEQEIEAASRTIKAGKLDGDDLAEAFCARAIANAFIGKAKEALADADEAVRVAPAKADMLGCRGDAKFAASEFVSAIADYTKALTLGGDANNAYYRRGHVRYYAGQFEAAHSDFERAAQGRAGANGDSGAAQYAQLWQMWTARRLSRPIPDSLVAQAKREAGGTWPRIALAMMVEERTPDQVIKFVEAQRGDEREMNLSEAHFYVGMYWLGKGRKDDARKHFQLARDRGIIMYIEHMAAGHELAR